MMGVELLHEASGVKSRHGIVSFPDVANNHAPAPTAVHGIR